jgi:hypothetical protein
LVTSRNSMVTATPHVPVGSTVAESAVVGTLFRQVVG